MRKTSITENPTTTHSISANDGLLTDVEVREFLESVKLYRESLRIFCLNKCGKEVVKKGTYCKSCGILRQGGDVRVSDEKEKSTWEKTQDKVLTQIKEYSVSKSIDIKQVHMFMRELHLWEMRNVEDKEKFLRAYEKTLICNLHPKSKTHFKPMIENWGEKKKNGEDEKKKNGKEEERFTKSQKKSLIKLVKRYFPYTKEEKEALGME